MSSEQDGDVTVFATVWSDRWVIVAFVACAGLAATTYSLVTPKVYRAEVLVQIQDVGGRGSAGRWPSEIANIAGLGPFMFMGGGERSVAIATLRSRALVGTFIGENHLLPILYSAAWDPQSGQWKDQEHPPTLWKAQRDFTENILKVEEESKSGLVTIAVEWKDPEQAKKWVTELVRRGNEQLRQRAVLEAERNLEFLQNQLHTVTQVELRNALYGLVESESKRLMLAKGGEEFVFKTIDDATVPETHIRPKRKMLVLLGLLLGLIVGSGFSLLRDNWRRTVGSSAS